MFVWLASAVWSSLSALARYASRRGWLKSAQLPVRVISVGNIQVGGAGKTPLVARIAAEAKDRGLQVCILCRGYGGNWEQSGGVILPAESPAARAVDCGDEAALLHDLVPSAVIGVGADRVKQFERARESFGKKIDLVILDDGFQHRKIKKDVEIVALTSEPRTRILYRDWRSALRHADLTVWTKGALPPDHGGRPFARVRYQLLGPADAQEPYWLVTGVADGRSVLTLAREAGYRVERHVSFPDHARYSEPQVRKLIEEAEALGMRIAVTGKDWVKWRDMGLSHELSDQVAVLEPELEWLEGREQWTHLLWGD
jgi:tetraacyldisaccharide 4'-kinase